MTVSMPPVSDLQIVEYSLLGGLRFVSGVIIGFVSDNPAGILSVAIWGGIVYLVDNLTDKILDSALAKKVTIGARIISFFVRSIFYFKLAAIFGMGLTFTGSIFMGISIGVLFFGLRCITCLIDKQFNNSQLYHIMSPFPSVDQIKTVATRLLNTVV